MQLSPQVLTGRFVQLEPLAPDHRTALARALDCDSESWAILNSNGQGEAFDGWWTEASAQRDAGERIPFAVRRLADGEIVGTTSYHDLRPGHRGTAIGWTFYRPDVRGGVVNPECKLLLMKHAFDAGAVRVEIHVDAVNARSQAASLKLGAVREGVLRRHKITWTGRLRDTVIFSVIAEEWPGVQTRLMERLV